MKKILIFLLIIFAFNTNVSAASLCSYQEQTELNSKASNIKASYEIIEEVIGTEDTYINMYFKISIVNVTEDFYIIIKNNNTNEELRYTTSDQENGIITFNYTDVSKVTNFTLMVYTSSNTNCPDEKLKTLYFTTPRYNEQSDREICLEHSEFYLCQRYVTFAEIDDSEFLNKLDNYFNEEITNTGEQPTKPNPPTLIDKILNFIDNNKFFIIGGFLIILVISVIIHRKKTKKQRELGL